MKRGALERLMQVRDYPAVSVLAPTHRTYPDHQQDRIRLDGLIKEAAERLYAEFPRREVEPIVNRLEKLAEDLDHTRNLDGIALFASRDTEGVVRLRFRPEPRVIIDETFATRDLVHAANRAERYRVLVLGAQAARLLEGTLEELAEVEEGRFPIRPPAAEPLPSDQGWQGASPDAAEDERRRRFLRDVDAALMATEQDDPLPLVVVGSEPWLALFREVTRQGNAVIGTVAGNFADASPVELGRKTEPVLKEWREKVRARRLKELEEAIGANRYASGIDQAWRAAKEGRARVLLVEEGYHQPARLAEDGLTFSHVADATAPDVVDDIVDELIEKVLLAGGEVTFFPPGELSQHQRVALMLRY
ncbi:MAG TPA: hypothetical protein VFX29_02060 [Longimicrobiaceae bacterium]|jgi:hypothetical protein|nr:hypothetical protein [Longimicrobiaceae bacterium]